MPQRIAAIGQEVDGWFYPSEAPPKPALTCGASGFYEAPFDRVTGQLDAVAHSELLKDIGSMAVDGLVADDQRFRDLLAGLSLSDQLHYLKLMRGQRILGYVLLAGSGSLEVIA